MSVVFHRSAGKMILKGFVAAIVFSFAWIKSVAGGSSYSNVFVQSGPGLSFYGPAAFRTQQLAPLAAAPLMSSLLPPCVSPCVVPGQQVAALAPVATSSANFVPLKSPISVPVVVAPTNDDAASYEYSYVVYDEDTGDQKAQKETSNGSVVRGRYSLIQPDGYVREVQYTADDLRGFNAVVKNFLPEAEPVPPCPEVKKSEPLKESNEKSEEAHDLEPGVQGGANEDDHSHEGHGHEGHEGHDHGEPKHEQNESKEERPEPTSHEKDEKHDGLENDGGHKEPESHSEPERQESHDKPESLEEHRESGEKVSDNKKEEPSAPQGGEVVPVDVNALVSYNDVIKCIQSAIKGSKMPQPSLSPLTYIILNKPC